MTTEEKATKIAESLNKANGSNCLLPCHQAAIVMAKWKEQQMIEKACEWLEDNLASFWQCKFYDDIAFIDDFKKAMKGGAE